MSDNPNGIVPQTARQSAAIFGQLTPIGDTRRAEDRPAKKPEPAPEDEALEAPEMEAEEFDGADDVVETEDEAPSDDVYVVRVDGQEVEVTLDELLSGYSRQSDYTRKTQTLAEERKKFEGERQSIKQMADTLSARLQQVEGFLSQSFQEPDWAELSKTLDPREYNQARAVYDQQQRQLDAIRRQQAELQQIQAQERQRELERAVQRLPELIPEWSDQGRAREESREIAQYALQMGFSQEALDNLYDPLAMAVLRKAWKFDQLQAQKPKIVKKTAQKTARAGSGINTKSKRQQQMERALKGPVKVREAADFFQNIKPVR